MKLLPKTNINLFDIVLIIITLVLVAYTLITY